MQLTDHCHFQTETATPLKITLAFVLNRYKAPLEEQETRRQVRFCSCDIHIGASTIRSSCLNIGTIASTQTILSQHQKKQMWNEFVPSSGILSLGSWPPTPRYSKCLHLEWCEEPLMTRILTSEIQLDFNARIRKNFLSVFALHGTMSHHFRSVWRLNKWLKQQPILEQFASATYHLWDEISCPFVSRHGCHMGVFH